MKKKNVLLAVMAIGCTHLFAQTNTFPTSGNVGIGTITPAEKLTVLTGSNIVGIVHSNGTVKLGSVINNTGAFFGTTTNHPLFLRTNNNGAQVTILQNGNVGIGTTTPMGKLDVTGDIFINGTRVGNGSYVNVGNTCLGVGALSTTETNPVDYPYDISGGHNTALGAFALNDNFQGWRNTAVGSEALAHNSLGSDNCAVGYNSLNTLSGGDNNVAVGASALSSNTSSGNTALGAFSLTDNTSGIANTAAGLYSLYNNTTGDANIAVGTRALYTAAEADNNTAVGYYSMYLNTSGTLNTAIGYKSLDSNTTGAENTAAGANALLGNKTGNYNTANGSNALLLNASGANNTATGRNALYSNRSGHQNTATGIYALYANTTGGYNTAVGRYALYTNTTASENTAVGDLALYVTTTGGFNTAIGYIASPNAGALSNTTALGYNARTTASNQVRVGNSSVTSIGGYANWTNISDGRVKRNIKENVPGLTFINKLKPVTYNLSLAEADKLIKMEQAADEFKDGKKEDPELQVSRAAKEKIVYTGFIAQDVEKAALSVQYDFSGVDAPGNDKDLYGLRYAEFVVPLVKSVQELSKQNDEKDARINDLQKQIDELKELMKGKNALTSTPKNETVASAALEQNNPNPFSNATTIRYTLPADYSSAAIVITGNTGKIIKELNVSGKGKGSVNVNTEFLNAGKYQYTLYVNNQLSDSKQMVLIR